MYSKKKIFTSVCIILCFEFIDNIRDLVYLLAKGNIKYKYLSIVLIMLPIYIIGTYIIKQRNWRIGCIAIGCNLVLGYIGSLIGERVAIWICSLRILLAIAASLNFYIWFKSSGKIEALIPPRTKLNKLMILGAILMIIGIFVFWSIGR